MSTVSQVGTQIVHRISPAGREIASFDRQMSVKEAVSIHTFR